MSTSIYVMKTKVYIGGNDWISNDYSRQIEENGICLNGEFNGILAK